jgi:hypothetical protein
MDRTQAVVGVEDLKTHHPPSHVLSEGVKTACGSQFSDLGRVRRLAGDTRTPPNRQKLFYGSSNGQASVRECVWGNGAILTQRREAAEDLR